MYVLFNCTPVTATCAVTVTAQLAVLLLLSVVDAVIVAVPGVRPVTCPSADTTATDALLEVQLRFWLLAVAGRMVACKEPLDPPTDRVMVDEFRLKPVTGTELRSG